MGPFGINIQHLDAYGAVRQQGGLLLVQQDQRVPTVRGWAAGDVEQVDRLVRPRGQRRGQAGGQQPRHILHAPAEGERRAVRHFGQGLDRLGRVEDLQGAGGGLAGASSAAGTGLRSSERSSTSSNHWPGVISIAFFKIANAARARSRSCLTASFLTAT